MPTAPTTDPLSDTEAESVLMSLGSSLTWDEHSPRIWIGFGPDDRGYNLYDNARSDVKNRRYAVGPLGSNAQADFDTLAEAKAACEHHHATGKWE